MKKVMRLGVRRGFCLLVVIVLLAGYTGWAIQRPLPLLQPLGTSTAFSSSVGGSKLVWPGNGQAAVGVMGTPILETNGGQAAAPIASAAKMITALTILRTKPLAIGESGPTITLTASDVALYNAYVAHQGSVVPVNAGERISQYQMLQAILLPSANNMADSLAIWAFGSLEAYATAANSYVSGLGLTQTHIGSDASGLAPSTTSSAQDLVALGKLAMQNPVMAQIVGQSTASGLPIVNTVKNVNFLLGTSSIVGIKTGNTDEAGGVFVAAARFSINNKPVTIVTAVVGAPSLFVAMKTSLALVSSAQTNFKSVPIITKGTTVGHYDLPWGGSTAAIASRDLNATTWTGNPIPSPVKLQPLPKDAQADQIVGSLTIPESAINQKQSIPIKLQTTPSQPTTWWRLTHPL